MWVISLLLPYNAPVFGTCHTSDVSSAHFLQQSYSVQPAFKSCTHRVIANGRLGALTKIFSEGTFVPKNKHRTQQLHGVFLEKVSVHQLLQEFPAFYGTLWIITVLTTAHHLSLSSARVIHSRPSQHISLRLTFTFCSHLRPDFPSGSFLYVSPPRVRNH